MTAAVEVACALATVKRKIQAHEEEHTRLMEQKNQLAVV
jgi:hypothetical protein